MQHEWYLLNKNRLEEGWMRMFGALRATRDLLKQQNVGFLVLIMPSRYLYEFDRRRSDFARGLVSRAAKIAKQNGILYIDFTQCFASLGGDKVFLDTVHPNVRANEAIGPTLFEHLKESVSPKAEQRG